MVSGETGQPLMDKCIQYGEDASASTESSIPGDADGGGGDEGGGGDLGFQGMMMNPGAVPMQLQASGTMTMTTNSFSSESQQTMMNEEGDDSDIEITQITNPQNLNVQVKQEPGMFSGQQQQQQQQPQQQGMMGNQGMMAGQGMMGQEQMMGQQQQPQAYQVPIAPKPYQCSICRKAFKSVHVLQKHTLTFHTPGGGGGSGLRNRGRGSRGSRGNRGGRGRGRGRGARLNVNRPTIAAQQFQQSVPTVKTEADVLTGPNRLVFTQMLQK